MNKVCFLSFWDGKSDEYDYLKYKGRFPGPINNFYLLDFNEFLFDPHIEFQHTNLFINTNVKENRDFKVVSNDVFNKLQSFFGCNYAIQRHSVVINQSSIVDVFLKRVVLILIF